MGWMGDETFDTIVVGGGPAGSTVASLVAARGNKVLLLDEATFPRYQIGESLIPSTILLLCNRLGLREKLSAAGFQPKGERSRFVQRNIGMSAHFR